MSTKFNPEVLPSMTLDELRNFNKEICASCGYTRETHQGFCSTGFVSKEMRDKWDALTDDEQTAFFDKQLTADPRAARIAELEAALRGCAYTARNYWLDYRTIDKPVAEQFAGIAEQANRALNPSIELNLSDKETE